MIQAIVFDWGGVLIENPSPLLIRYCASYLHLSEDIFLQSYLQFEQEFQKGTISEDTLWRKVCTDLGIETPHLPSLWESAFRSAYQEKKQMFPLVSSLKKNGYKTGFLSNTECPAITIFKEHHYDMFDVIVFSCVEGTRKPEETIYRLTLNRLQVQPSETVFIDDRQEYLDGAKNVGIHTILFTTYTQLIKDLATLSIHIG